jgi:oxygen-independent coproporphyrinogen-3 oxidase
MLEVAPGTPLQRKADQQLLRLPDEDAVADWYLASIDLLESSGYSQYEISNFSRPGFECRHNLKYWRREPVLAFGVSAHSFDGRVRYANVPDLETYLGRLEAGRSPIGWSEEVSGRQVHQEMVFLGLRLSRGMDCEELRAGWPEDRAADCEAAVGRLTQSGLLERSGAAVRLSGRGMLLSNEVFQQLM